MEKRENLANCCCFVQTGLRVDLRGLERRVEECVAIAGASVSSVQSRCAGLEEVCVITCVTT